MTEAITKRKDELPASVLTMMDSAIAGGASVEALEKLVALHERMEDRYAEREAYAALRIELDSPRYPRLLLMKRRLRLASLP